jgi:hypothetical protein
MSDTGDGVDRLWNRPLMLLCLRAACCWGGFAASGLDIKDGLGLFSDPELPQVRSLDRAGLGAAKSRD